VRGSPAPWAHRDWVRYATVRRTRTLDAMRRLLLIAFLVVACGTNTPASESPTHDVAARPATRADLTGAWRAEPFVLDPLLATQVDRVCRRDPSFPIAHLDLVLIDARGGGRLPTLYAMGDATADCLYTQISGPGVVTGSLSGTGTGQEAQLPAGKLSLVGTGSIEKAWSYRSGRVGLGIERVVVDVAGFGPITATLQNGWWFVWWPGASERGKPEPRVIIAGFDTLGAPVDQLTE
jgi:hypothetical protein